MDNTPDSRPDHIDSPPLGDEGGWRVLGDYFIPKTEHTSHNSYYLGTSEYWSEHSVTQDTVLSLYLS